MKRLLSLGVLTVAITLAACGQTSPQPHAAKTVAAVHPSTPTTPTPVAPSLTATSVPGGTVPTTTAVPHVAPAQPVPTTTTTTAPPVVVSHPNIVSPSSRWTGYTYTGFTNDVSAYVTLPQSPPCGPTEDSTISAWVGIDQNTAVEQVVAYINCHNGADYYGIVYEMYPADYYPMTIAIHPGDTVLLNEQEQSSGVYEAHAYDINDGQTAVAVAAAPYASGGSGECMVESNPDLGMLRFGQISFSGCVTDGTIGIPGANVALVMPGTNIVPTSATDFYVTGPN